MGKKAPEELFLDCEKQNCLDFFILNSKQHVWKNPGIDYHLINIQSYGVAWWDGGVWGTGIGRLLKPESKLKGVNENLIQKPQNLRLGRGFTFQQDNEPMSH